MASENQNGGDDYLIPIESTEYMIGESSEISSIGESSKTRSTHDQILSLMPMRPGATSSSSNAVKENMGGDRKTFHDGDRFFLPSSTNQVWSDGVPRCYSELVPNSSQCTPFPASNELGNHQHPGQESEAKNLKVILWKRLTKTDVGRTGRIIVPKGWAQRGLPHLNNKDVMTLFMGDLFSGKLWTFRYRFWTNNSSRIYVIERTGRYIRSHHLQKDDLLVIYKEKDSEAYYIAFSKEIPPPEIPPPEIPPPNLMDDKKDNANNQQLVRDGNERELRCQLCHKPSKCLAHVCNLSTKLLR